MATKSSGNLATGFMGFVKSISLRTWIIGAFVVLFLIWFIPKAGMFAKIAGALGTVAALGFLAPILLPLITALLGGLAAVVATSIASFQKYLKENPDATTADAKEAAEGEAKEVNDHIAAEKWEGEELKEANRAGAARANEALTDDTKVEDIGHEVNTEMDETVGE